MSMSQMCGSPKVEDNERQRAAVALRDWQRARASRHGHQSQDKDPHNRQTAQLQSQCLLRCTTRLPGTTVPRISKRSPRLGAKGLEKPLDNFETDSQMVGS